MIAFIVDLNKVTFKMSVLNPIPICSASPPPPFNEFQGIAWQPSRLGGMRYSRKTATVTCKLGGKRENIDA